VKPLRERILAALELQPMSNVDVARCMGVTQQTAHRSLTTLCTHGQIRRRGWETRKHKSGPLAQLFELVA
jgi:DNA-binding IclR family transcriptional regulator